VEGWITRKALLTNPFALKNRVVGIGGTFARMLSEDEALIGPPDCAVAACSDAVMISRTSPTQFTARTPVIIVGKVIGLAEAKTANGEISLPKLELVAASQCMQSSCNEFGGIGMNGCVGSKVRTSGIVLYWDCRSEARTAAPDD